MSNSNNVIHRNPSLNETIELLSSDEEECTKNVIDDLIDDESQSLTAHTANSNTIAKANAIEDNMLTTIKNQVSYPDFYHRGINSDKDGNILESKFLNEDWMTNELVDKNSFAAKKKCTIRKMKTQINCPFVIRWSCPGIKDKSQAPIFRKVYITQCNPNHTCGICVESFRIAMRMSKSSGKFDLKTLSNVLKVTKIDPFLPAKHLRSLL
mgnify:CR=1 FL=1